MAKRKTDETVKPASPVGAGQPDAERVEQEQTTDYKRCGGHILTDFGWVPERR